MFVQVEHAEWNRAGRRASATARHLRLLARAFLTTPQATPETSRATTSKKTNSCSRCISSTPVFRLPALTFGCWIVH
jgi:hypothetical protein